MNIDEVIKEAQELLLKNPEWMDRYSNYADLINKKTDFISECRSRYKDEPPFFSYISTSNAITAKYKIKFDVRYRGQTVAVLKVSKKEIILTTSRYDEKNERDFGCKHPLQNEILSESKAIEFINFFKDRNNERFKTDNNKHNEEHNIQDLLLTEFSKTSSIGKQILGIQPISICKCRYGMPTPLGASDHKKLKYSNHRGGGIDVLARTGRGTGTYLTVVEVKDENKKGELPEDALKQAIQYAVFIRELLRSKSGEKWYKLFGFSGAIPKRLVIRAVCAMPDDKLDKSFANDRYPIEHDIIECHYMYFKYDGKQLSDFQTSLMP